jgi:hypothetical protein
MTCRVPSHQPGSSAWPELPDSCRSLAWALILQHAMLIMQGSERADPDADRRLVREAS